MTTPEETPEFDPRTWTPDKPWPKGYYKPVPGLIAQIDRQDQVSGDGSGFRGFLWILVTLPLQVVGLIAAMGNRLQHGLLHTISTAITPVPLFLFFALLLPTLLHVGIVAPDGARLRRSFAYGLGWSAASLVFIGCAIMVRPLVHLLFEGAIRLLQP